jgi:hypothetical protein
MPSTPLCQDFARAGAATVTTSPGLDWDGAERRVGADRRHFSLRTLLGGGLSARRRRGRRASDHALPIVDWHDAHLLAVSMSILLLCSADAWLTLMLLTRGAAEANPFMAALIQRDLAIFTGAKMLLTGLGVVLLVMLARVRVAGPVRAWHLLYVVLAGYGWLIAYELQMLATFG